jgi:hypothetical protein
MYRFEQTVGLEEETKTWKILDSITASPELTRTHHHTELKGQPTSVCLSSNEGTCPGEKAGSMVVPAPSPYI